MMCKRKRKRRVGNTRSVTYFTYKKKISHQERLFHGWCWNGIRLYKESTDKRSSNYCKDDSINPFAGFGFALTRFGFKQEPYANGKNSKENILDQFPVYSE